MIRSVQDWRKILKGLTPEQAAKRILGDITHYTEGRSYEKEDHKQLAAAMTAFKTPEGE